MILRHFLLDVNEANAFVLGCDETREAVLIDAGEFNPAIVGFMAAQELRLSAIFITHDHFDHTGGLAEAVRHFGATVFAGSPNPSGCEAHVVRHGESIAVGRLTGKVLATPGHTPDGLSLAFPGHVFTGDALFAGSVGGTGSQDLYDEQIAHIRENIFTLPPNTEVHTGHGPSSTVAVESNYNPFFV
jgi:hydroxyacylglutathione hydrolase